MSTKMYDQQAMNEAMESARREGYEKGVTEGRKQVENVVREQEVRDYRVRTSSVDILRGDTLLVEGKRVQQGVQSTITPPSMAGETWRYRLHLFDGQHIDIAARHVSHARCPSPEALAETLAEHVEDIRRAFKRASDAKMVSAQPWQPPQPRSQIEEMGG